MLYSILIVDDSLPMRAVIKRTLKAAGYGASNLFEAANGEQALALMKNSWVDLVITDYNMPVMDGLEFIKTMKEQDLFQDIPVVVVSTEGNQTRIDEFMNAGAAGYITKPFTAEAIRDVIVTILGEADYEDTTDDGDDDFDF
ncbi:MAG: response regulator [Desulfobacteraceae bacterium]|nr:response regulator [Desulfobacteraceae bacterium]